MSHAVQSSRTSRFGRFGRLGRAAAVAAGATVLTLGLAGSAFAAAPAPLPWQASAFQTKYMPYFDYDGNGCYPSSAVDPSGWLNGGLQPVGSPSGDCHYLGRANTYVRTACDPTWCAYVYALYFEKDQGPIADHRHDWEAVVVWQRRGQEQPSYVSASAHGKFDTRTFTSVERDGNRAKIVYHLDGATTHAFRFAKSGEQPEAWGPGSGWDQPALVALDKLKGSNRKAYDALKDSEWGSANFPIQDRGDRFRNSMRAAKPSAISFNPTIDWL